MSVFVTPVFVYIGDDIAYVNSLTQFCLQGSGMLQCSRRPWILLFLSVFCPCDSACCMLMLWLFVTMPANMNRLIRSVVFVSAVFV